MATRDITHTRKDRDGDITALCRPGEWWSPRAKQDAIRDIEGNTHTYYASWNDGQRTLIRVVNGATGKYLRTDRDDTSKNNLDDLPDC